MQYGRITQTVNYSYLEVSSSLINYKWQNLSNFSSLDVDLFSLVMFPLDERMNKKPKRFSNFMAELFSQKDTKLQ